MPDVRLVDLEVIKKFSLAVRRDVVPAEELLDALDASREAVLAAIAAAGGPEASGTRRPRSSAVKPPAVAKPAPAKKPRAVAQTVPTNKTAPTNKRVPTNKTVPTKRTGTAKRVGTVPGRSRGGSSRG